MTIFICTVELVQISFFCKILEFWLAFGYLFLSIIVDESNRDRTAFSSTLRLDDTVGEDDALRRRGIARRGKRGFCYAGEDGHYAKEC